MRAEFTGTLRRASFHQIRWTRADDAADRADAARCQTAVRKLADPDCEIDMLFQDIGDAVRQCDPNIDVRKSPEELDRDRKNVQAAEDDRCGDDQVASRRAVFT